MKSISLFLFLLCFASLHSSQKLSLAMYPLETLDPRKLHSVMPKHILRALYERLVRFEPDGKIHPAIAKTIEISNDKKTYTFHLRESFWSDGSPVLAKEFIEAWKESIASKTLYVKNWFLVKNGRQVVNNELPFDQLGVTSPDEKTIVIQLERPTTYFLELMEDVSCSPIKEGIDSRTPEWASQLNENYICNGPFRIESGKEDEVLFLEKNPFYWDADSVLLEKIRVLFTDLNLFLNLFESEEIDWIGTPLGGIGSNLNVLKKNHRLFFPQPVCVCILAHNVSCFPLSDVNLRRALSCAINRNQLSTLEDKNHTPALTFLLPKYSVKNYFSEEEDLKKAHFYFDQFLRKHNLTPSNISFKITGGATNQNSLEFLQEQWKKNLGIHIDIDICDSKTFNINLNRGNFEIAFANLGCGRYNDPTEQFSHFLSPVAKNNLSHWSNSAFIRLVNLAEEQTHCHIRSTQLAWAEEIFIEELPQIPLNYQNTCYAKNPRLQNEFTLNSTHVDFRWAFFSKESEDV